jgi:hypothetical protein
MGKFKLEKDGGGALRIGIWLRSTNDPMSSTMARLKNVTRVIENPIGKTSVRRKLGGKPR